MKTSYSSTLALITAKVLFETLPDVTLLGRKETSIGFAYEFTTSYPLPQEGLTFFEEKVAQEIRKQSPIRFQEMVPISAAGLLKSIKLDTLAKQALKKEGILSLGGIEGFFDLVEGPLLPQSQDLIAFELLSLEEIDSNHYRIQGVGFEEKSQCKAFLKAFKGYQKQARAREKGLFYLLDENVIWTARALHQKKIFFEKVLESFPKEWIQVESDLLDKEEACRACGIGEKIFFEKVKENPSCWDEERGLLASRGEEVLFHGFGVKEPLFDSFLQSVEKTLNILAFPFRKKTSRGKVEWIFEDILGREWSIWTLKKSSFGIVSTASIERLYALLLYR